MEADNRIQPEVSPTQTTPKSPLRRIGNAIVTSVFGVLSLVLLLLLGLQFPAVQTWLGNYATHYLSRLTGFEMHIERIAIRWLDHAVLKGVAVKDRSGAVMIAASELSVDYDLVALIKGNDIILNRTRLAQLTLNLVANGKNGELNISELIEALSRTPSDTTPSSSRFVIEQALLQDCVFGYCQPQIDSLTGTGEFDYNHFTLDRISGEVRNFVSVRDSILLQASNLSAREATLNWNIHHLNTSFVYCDKGIFFDNLDLHIGKSYLRRRLALAYSTPDAMDDFNNRVRIYAELDSVTLHTDDIAHFAPSLASWQTSAQLSGVVDGHLSRLHIRNLRLAFGQNTNINGNLYFDGLPNIDQTLMQLQFRPSRLSALDLKVFLSEDQFATVRKLGDVRFNGQFVGYLNDFVARGQFETAIGTVRPDINVKVDQKVYSGQVTTENFQLGNLADISLLGAIDAHVNMKGKGFTLNEMETEIKGHIAKLGLRGYSYKNIQTDVSFKKGIVAGFLKIADPNFAFEGTGEVSLPDSTIRLKASLDRADLQKLHFVNQIAFARADIDCNFRGLTLDNLRGDIRLDSFYFAYDKKDVLFDTLKLHSELNGNKRSFYIRSDLIDVESEGNFKPSTTIADLTRLINEYMLYIGNDSEEIEKYYSQKLIQKLKKKPSPVVESPYQVDYLIRIKNLNPLIQIFVPDFYLACNTILQGQFRSGITQDFALQLQADTLRYGNFFLQQITADYQTVKVTDANQISANLMLHSAYLNQVGERSQVDTLLQKLQIDAEWLRDRISYQIAAQAAHSDDHGTVKGDFRFLPGKRYLAAFHPSFAVLNKQKWQNTDTATIMIQGREIQVKDLYFSDGHRFVSVKGGISENPQTSLEIEIQKIGIELLSSLIGKKIEGEADGKVFLKDLYNEIQADGFLFARHVKLEGFSLGEIRNFIQWNQETQSLAIESRMLYDTREALQLKGTYKQSNNALDLLIDLKQTEINVLESFLSEIVSNMAGRAAGQLRVYGQADAPHIAGELFITGGRFRVNYLNTTYFFDDRILFEDDRIAVKRLRLRDDEQNVAFIDGGIYHYGFTNFVIDMRADFRQFKVLDTQQTEDALYYGTAIATGRMEIFGPPENMKITINAISQRGTRIFMPLDGYASAQEKSFIRFVSLKSVAAADTIATELSKTKKLDLSKLVIVMNLEITPEAQMEIILDRKAGDIIRGNARGKLKMELDTRGDFTMFGDVEIVRGSYTFTFQNLFNKSFEIAQGSSIAWNGDPFKGKMNITASYDQKVSLAPILSRAQLDSTTLNRPELKRRYPVRVNLFLTGELLKPMVTYDIEFFDYPRTIVVGGVPISLETSIAAFKARLAGDEQELQKQVFSLLMLRKLLPENAFEGISQSAGNSLSELITNQLSAWMSQVDENLEVDIDLNGFDANALNTMQLRLSYSFMNGRMRITRDGSFTNVQNQANLSSIAGDWTVEYMLTPDGKLRMKMYRRNITNTFNAALLGTNATTGASMMYTRSFNYIAELFGRKRRKFSQRSRSSVIPYRDNRIYIPPDHLEQTQ